MNTKRVWAMFAVAGVLGALVSGASGEDTQGLVLPFKQVSVGSPVQEIIRQVFVEEGDAVAEGQPLAQLANEKEMLDVQQYEKLIERRDFEAKGAETLLKEDMTSKEQALEKRTDLELAKIQYGIAIERLNEKTIKAPLSGIVVKKYKESGEAVDRVEKMFDIVNIDKVYIQFYLDPKLVGRIAEGAKVPVKFPAESGLGELDAAVSFVDPRIDAASGMFRVKLLVDNPGHKILAGMRGQADFDRAMSSK